MNIQHYLPAARLVAEVIPDFLAKIGLKPFISRFVLTETQQGNAWLFIVLEVDPLSHLEDYGSAEVLKYLSTSLNGMPVVISNSYGMRYAVLLSSPHLVKMAQA